MDFDILKYLAWAIPMAISFCGAWFFQFTTTDKSTHRRRFTRFGKIAFVFAIAGLFIAAYLLIDGDLESKAAKANAAKEREANQEYRAEAKKEREEIVKRIWQLVQAGNVSTDQFSEIAKTVLTTEEILKLYPETEVAIASAETIDDLWTIGENTIALNAAARFDSSNGACTALYEKMPDTPGWTASFKSNDGVVFTSAISASWVTMSIIDNKAFTTRPYDITKGDFYLEFEDGAKAKVECGDGTIKGLCRANFTESQINGNLHSKLRKGRVTNLLLVTEDGDQNRIGITSEASQNLMLVGGCTAR